MLLTTDSRHRYRFVKRGNPCDCGDVSPQRARHRAHVDTVERRYDVGGPHLAAGRCRTEPGSCDPGISPLPQTRWDLRARRADASVSRRPRLRRRSRRSSRLRRVEWLAVRRVRKTRAGRWRRGDRVVGRATLVQRRRRDDGNLLGRLQWTSDGGTLLAADGLEWGSFLFGSMCLPPDPVLVGDRWRAMWLERLENVPLFFETWLRHQRRDAYWKHGSVCEDYAAIQCPVYAVGGWSDAYTNAIPRLLERLCVPRKGLIGPWAHGYPHFARPGPQIGFLQETLRWWDCWLKGIDTGVMDEPMLRASATESVKLASRHDTLPGRWVAEPSWPPPGITPQC